jgi:hypothetical protein
MTSPSVKGSRAPTGERRRKVPFVLFRSPSEAVRAALSIWIRACWRETPLASSQTLHCGSRPMMLSPSDSGNVWFLHTSQQRVVRARAVAAGSNTVHGPDESRTLRFVLHRFPDFADQHVQIRIADVGIGPDSCVQLGLSEDLRPPFEQNPEQVEGLRGKVDLELLAAQLPRLRVDGERSDSNPHGLDVELRHGLPGNYRIFRNSLRLRTRRCAIF